MPPVNRQQPMLADPTSNPVIASYDNYLDAQAAVDKLSDNKFPVQKVAIVGVNLRMVEQVLGRMSLGRAAAGGLFMGAWFGLLLGIFISLFAAPDTSYSPTVLVLMGIAYGAAFGIIFGLISHAFTGGKRDFVSRSQFVASTYDVHVEADGLDEAKKLLGLSGAWPPPIPESDTALPGT